MIKRLALILIASLVLNSCNSALPQNVVATVDDVEISVLEFQYRYNFNPYLRHIKNESLGKQEVLIALLAEKLLSAEAAQQNFTRLEIEELSEQRKKEAMIEQLRRDSVEARINISDEELKKEYIRAGTQLNIRFVAVQDSGEAMRLQAFVDSAGNFEKNIKAYMAIKGWRNEPVPTKTIKWAAEDLELEDQLYRLNDKEIKGPIKSHGEFYVTEISSESKSFTPGMADFKKRLPALEDRIRRRKIKHKYDSFFVQNIRPELPEINWQDLRTATDELARTVIYNSPVAGEPEIKPKGLPIELAKSSLNTIQEIGGRSGLIFPDGKMISVKQVFTGLSRGAFVFNYNNEKKFRRSVAKNIALLAELETMYSFAKYSGYEHNSKAMDEARMWRGYFQGGAWRQYQLSSISDSSSAGTYSTLTPIQEKRLDFMDTLLDSLAARHTININIPVYKNILLNKQDMIVHKLHFPNRLLAPPLEPLFGLKRWRAHVLKLLDQE